MAKINVNIILRIISAIFCLVAAALISSRAYENPSGFGGGGGGRGLPSRGDIDFGRFGISFNKCGIRTHNASVNSLLIACASYFIILAIFFVMHVFEHEVDNEVEGGFLIIGCIYTFVAGCMVIASYMQCKDMLRTLTEKFMAGGVMSLIAGIFMLFDCLIAFKVFK